MHTTDFLSQQLASFARIQRCTSGNSRPTFYDLPENEELTSFCYDFLRNEADYLELKQTMFTYMAKKAKKLKDTPEFQELYQRLYPELFI